MQAYSYNIHVAEQWARPEAEPKRVLFYFQVIENRRTVRIRTKFAIKKFYPHGPNFQRRIHLGLNPTSTGNQSGVNVILSNKKRDVHIRHGGTVLYFWDLTYLMFWNDNDDNSTFKTVVILHLWTNLLWKAFVDLTYHTP